MKIQIGQRAIGENEPTYFIADVAANHDGKLRSGSLLAGFGAARDS